MQFPGPFRAVVGFLASAADEAKHLPDKAIELPMLAVSTALQASLRAQQRYARLAARGDEVLHRRRPATDEPPPWATFDAPVAMDEPRRGAAWDEQATAASDLLDELLGGADEPSADGTAAAPDGAAPDAAARDGAAPASRTPVKKAPPAKKAAPARKAPAAKKATPAAPAHKAPARRAADSAARGKSVSKPRHTAPSRFDAVDDDGQ